MAERFERFYVEVESTSLSKSYERDLQAFWRSFKNSLTIQQENYMLHVATFQRKFKTTEVHKENNFRKKSVLKMKIPIFLRLTMDHPRYYFKKTWKANCQFEKKETNAATTTSG